MYQQKKFFEMMLDHSRLFIIMGMILAALFAYRTCSMNSAREIGVQIGTLKQTNVQLVQDVKEAAIAAEVIEFTKEVETKAIVDMVAYEKTTAVKVQKRVEQVYQKTNVINADVVLTDVEKDIKVAEVQIDSLWEAYCDTPGSSCSNDSLT